MPWIYVHATWLPRHLVGKFHALCANLRCLWLVVSSGDYSYLNDDCSILQILALWRDYGSVDIWILDQVLPLLS